MNLIMSLNLKNMASTQLSSLAVNSVGVFNGELFVSSADGIHRFVGGSNEEVVNAFFELPLSLLGYNGKKTPRSLLISGRILGALKVSITDESGVTVVYLTETLDTFEGTKVALQSNQRGRYFNVKIENVDGAYFSIDQIDMVFIPGPEPRK